MCGISGYVSSRELAGEQMVKALLHRGPDHCGSFKTTIAQKHVFLGHDRLSIIDLSEAGHQPMSTPDGQIVIVFNGEIYNFAFLKEKYCRDFPFRSRTDTEVLLYLYRELGIDFICELNGDFAFALLDRPAKKLYLVRDRAGVKPLYYYLQGDTLVFGSEIKSLLAAGIEPQLAGEYLQSYFVCKYVPGNHTLLSGIDRLCPGCFLAFDIGSGRAETRRYWTLRKDPAIGKLSWPESRETLQGLLQDAVHIRLMADVPLGTFLSGGLDSSIIAYFLKGRADITHYCARKNRADLDREGTTSDYHYASALARAFNLDLEGIDIGQMQLNLPMIRKVLYFSDDLIADGAQIPSYLITRQAVLTSRVILSGMGADELFLGYAGHQITLLSLLLDRLPSWVSRLLTAPLRKLSQGKGSFLAYRRYLHKLGRYFPYPRFKYALFNTVGDFENACSVFNGDRQETIRFFQDYFPADADVFDSIFHYEFDNFLVKNLHYLDRMAMANSVEARVPYLDHRVIEFAYSLDRRYRLASPWESKRILRRTFTPLLPPEIIKRRKAGFGMPLRSIFGQQQTIDELFDREFFRAFPGFSPADIDRVIAHHLSGKEDNANLIFALVSFQEWYKMNFT